MNSPISQLARRLRTHLLLALLILAAGSAQAQTPAAIEPGSGVAPPAADGKPVCEDTQAASADDTIEVGEATAAPPPEDCIALTPEPALDEAVDAGEMRASMRRFIPSEQISEDSSVAFPNDI